MKMDASRLSQFTEPIDAKPYDLVEFDAHKIDLVIVIVFFDEYGRRVKKPLHRFFGIARLAATGQKGAQLVQADRDVPSRLGRLRIVPHQAFAKLKAALVVQPLSSTLTNPDFWPSGSANVICLEKPLKLPNNSACLVVRKYSPFG